MAEPTVAPTSAPNQPIDAKSPQTVQASPQNLTPAEKKIWKLKVDGKEMDFDASDEENVKRHLSKSFGADKRFEEAAASRRQAEEFLRLVKADPEAFLNHPKLGLNAQKIAEQIIWKAMQEEKMTPQERRIKQLEMEAEQVKQREEHFRREEANKKALALQSHYEQDFERKIMSALDTGGVPKTPDTVKMMANMMSLAIKNGLDLEPQDIAREVRNRYQKSIRHFAETAPPETLFELLGEAGIKRLRDADLKRLKTTQNEQFKTPEPKPISDKSSNKPKRISGDDWRKQLMVEAGLGPKKRY